MAQSFQTDAGLLIIPGAYPTFKVEASNSGISTTGVLMLVGEADQGQDATLEEDINANAFGPGQAADVVAKYKSGPLVDAFRAAISAANDPDITGSFNRIILTKTNISTKAASTLINFDLTVYSAIQDRSFGKLGNLISSTVTTKQAETIPATPPFAFLPPIASTNISLSVNGGAISPLTLAPQETPPTFKAALLGIAGIDVVGGDNEDIITAPSLGNNLSLAIVSGNRVSVNFAVPYDALPSVGDTLWIPTTSVLADDPANAGSYIVTGATATSILATKLLDATGAPNALTPPNAHAPVAAAAITDVVAFSAMTITQTASDPVPGLGKAIEIAELTSAAGRLSYVSYELTSDGNPLASTWMSKLATPKVIVSAAEYIAKLTVARQLDSITEDLTGGGSVALQIGYIGTSASLFNDGTTITITMAGGAGAGLSPITLDLVDYPTVGDLASFIGSLPGFTAAPGTAVLGAQPSLGLDQGIFDIVSIFASMPGRIKQDAYKFFTNVNGNSVLVQIPFQASAGQPGPQALNFLSGGAKGATTDATFNAAVDKLQLARGNFLVPLFSRDASEDIADNLTDVSSTYTIDNIHSYCRAHVLTMSTLKRRRNRQAFLSKRSTFVNDKTAAGNMASFRCSMAFQDIKDLKASGGIFQFQPWMASLKAAAVQAAGFYRPLFRKNLAISGALQAANDFNPNDDDKMEDALLSGLLPIKQDETGGFYFVSDQTTYGKDNNFVFNSIQAVYIADTVTLTIGQIMEKAFVGQSLADVSAGFALATLDSIMEDMRRLKLTAASDDAPKGFKNASIKIRGGTMIVSLEIKLAGALYFIPITVSVSQVQQSAG